MRNRWRTWTAVALAGAMALGMAGCGSSGDAVDGSSSGTDTANSGDTLDVVIWDTNQQEGLQQIADMFTEETGIKVKIEVKDWDSYWTLLEAGASGGDMPDVFWMHSNNSQIYMNNDMLLDLTDYIENSDEIDMDNYMPEITQMYMHDGHYYAIPKDYDTIALWYNRTMFDEAGLSYPDATWTYDDMLEAAKKLTKPDGSQYGFAMNPSNDQDTYYNFVYAHGGYIVNEDHTKSGYDDPKTIEAMEYVTELLKYCPDPAVMSETGTDVLMQSGQVAMITQGSWMVAGFKDNDYMKENCDCAIIPYDGETGVRASITNGLGWAASATTSHPDECWKLIEWFGSEAMQEKQAELGVTMSAYEGTSDKWVDSADYNLNAYLDVAKDSDDPNVTNELVLRPYTYNSTKWSTMAQRQLVEAWSDPSSMEEVCKNIAERMNDMIKNENGKVET